VRTRRIAGQRDDDAGTTLVVPALPPAAEHVLALQRTAGNAAVTRVLARYDELPTAVLDPPKKKEVDYSQIETQRVDVDADVEDEDESDFEDDDDEFDEDDEDEEVAPVVTTSSTPKRTEEEQREYDKKLMAGGYEVQPTAPVTAETKPAPVEVKEAKQETTGEELEELDAKALRKLEKKERLRAEKQAEREKIERAKQRRETFEQRREARQRRGGMGPALEAWVDPKETRSEQAQTREIEKLERRIAEVREWQRKAPARFTAQHASIQAQLDALIKEREARKAERERLRAARDAPPPRPYAFIVKGVEERYIDEEETTAMFVAGALDLHLQGDKQRHGVPEMPDRDAIKYLYGWTEEDCVKHYDNADKGQKATEAKTEQLRTEEQRAAHALELGGEIQQAGVPFDTSKSTSKASGPGFAIFVMSDTGRFYAGSHKVGLFHHSSLLGGEDAACGGEMKATAGKLEHVTNKSGHYLPIPEHLQQALGELARGGVKLGGVMATVWDTNAQRKVVKRRYDAADFMRRGREAKVLGEWEEG
jgi:hypothetical protein